MKNGLLINAGEAPVKNIGDYIQSVAQEQFFDQVDMYVEREALHVVESDTPINVIMNGWFMRHPKNFPPSSVINPLFVSIHIAPKIAEEMLSVETVAYLKKYEPIGCRDTGTQSLLDSKGIKNYYSGCLTLALGMKYHSEKKDGSFYFVDPYYELGAGCRNKIRNLKSLWLLIRHYKKVSKMQKNFLTEFYSLFYKISPRLNNLVMAACFYETYHNTFDDDILLNAKFVKHQVVQADFNNDDEKMEYARMLIRNYAKASLVVTSRIHCALPCIGVETPVLFVTSDVLAGSGLRSAGRFGGLIELFHVLHWTPQGFIAHSNEIKKVLSKGKFCRSNILSNSEIFKPLRDKLIKTVKSFIAKNTET